MAERKYPKTKFEEDAARIRPDGCLSHELELFQNSPAPDEVPAEFWKKYVKSHQDFNPSDLRIERDVLQNHHAASHCLKHPNVYADAEYFFCLNYKTDLIAVLGFDIERPGILVVRQIQGQEGQGEALKSVHWTRALLAYLEEWAKKAGISTIRVVPAQENHWVTKTFQLLQEKGAYPTDMTIEQACELSDELQKKGVEQNGRLLREEWKEKEAKAEEEFVEYVTLLLPHRAFMIYDVTAKKLKYTLTTVKGHRRGLEDAFWEKSL